jgi:hypothetical protein
MGVRHIGSSVLRKLNFLFPDKLYLTLLYRAEMGEWIDWKNPRSFTEKLQWLKIYDFKPEYTTMVDKYAVKDYVASIIGKKYIIPTLSVWDNVGDIDWESLPEQFVLKTTHGGGSGGVVICSDKSTLDIPKAKEKLATSMHRNAGSVFREKPYLKVRRRIIAERFITNSENELKDYKFFCFDGEVRFFKVDFGRFVEHHANYYSPEGKLLLFGEADFLPDFNHIEVLPDNLDEMITIAEKLSREFTFLRVDLYNVAGQIYFGELTFYPAAGFGAFTPAEWDRKLGDLIDLNAKIY